jgi:hypothetical protein
LRWLLAVLLAALGSGLLVASPASAANPIAAENQLPGDTAWMGAVTAHVNYVHPPIDGYASASSVRPGGTVAFYVGVPQPGRYRVEISRLGWYGGMGGRRLTCLVGSTFDQSCTQDEAGVVQSALPPPEPSTGEVALNWTATDHLQVPDSWVSGYYVAVFQLTTGPFAGETGFAPFIVQAPVGDHAPILVQVPTNTWQAYNAFGGESLYTSPEAVKVSFNRPYQHHHLFRWEYPLVRFLERGGYDVTYATDEDVDSDPSILLHHRLDIDAGHDEYWTKRMRDGWDAARAHGVNLAFMGANDVNWQVRYEDNRRTMVSYESLGDPEPDPALKTLQFRHLRPPRPECQLLGEESAWRDSEVGNYYSFTVTRAGAQDPWLAGSGLRAGSALPGVVGFEVDSVSTDPSCVTPPVTVLARFSGHPPAPGAPPLTADAVRYRACSGSEVFDAGSLFFSWGLDSWRDPEFSPPTWAVPPGADPPLQHIMGNALADMQIAHPRMRSSGAVEVSRHGTALLVDPGVPGGALSVRGTALRVVGGGRVVSTALGVRDGRTALSWRPRVPRSALAVVLRVATRTGDVRDSRQFLVLTDGRGRMTGGGMPLAAADCYGPSARVATPVFGAAKRQPLKVTAHVPGRFTVSVLHDDERAVRVRVPRRHPSAMTVRVGASSVPCGPVSVRLTARRERFMLAAVNACSR